MTDPTGKRGCGGDLVEGRCSTDRASGGDGSRREPDRMPTESELRDTAVVNASILAVPVLVATAAIGKRYVIGILFR